MNLQINIRIDLTTILSDYIDGLIA